MSFGKEVKKNQEKLKMTQCKQKSAIETFVKSVYIKRKLLGISQRELAKKAGITQASLSRLETKNIDRPSTATLKALCSTLGLDCNFWLKAFGYDINQYNSKKPTIEFQPEPDYIYFSGKKIPLKILSQQDLGLIATILKQYKTE